MKKQIEAITIAAGAATKRRPIPAFWFLLLRSFAAALTAGYAHAQNIPLGLGITFDANGVTKVENVNIPSGGSFSDTVTGSIGASTATAQVQIQSLGPNHWLITQTVQAQAGSNVGMEVAWGYSLVGAGEKFSSTASATVGGSTVTNSFGEAEFAVFSSGVLGLCKILDYLYDQGIPTCLTTIGTSGSWIFHGMPANETGSAELQCSSTGPDASCNATIITDITVGAVNTPQNGANLQFQQLLTATDPLGNVTTNVCDTKGNLLSTTTLRPPLGGRA